MNAFKKTLIGITTIVSLAASTQILAKESSKNLATDLLQRGLVEGDIAFIRDHVSVDYIQHNPQASDKLEGLLDFVSYLGSLDEPVAINPLRVIQAGDLVVVHSEYALDGPKAAFDLFRLADGKLVEHWNAIQDVPTTTVSGRSMTDGPTEITDKNKTAENKQLVTNFVADILVNGKAKKIIDYIGENYDQHNPNVGDGLEGLGAFMGYLSENNISFYYSKIHQVVAEGNFVFTQSEGIFGDAPTAFYDLFRVENGMIVEHWDVVQEIPKEFAHQNGMF